ncbi:MAG: PLP-dependent transferase [Planctomycetes bacterium]|nr:PLP-dependent transferase [Planctomycetota bacterium]
MLSRGIKTLAVRVERQNDNAMAIARALEEHPQVSRVFYPGLPSHEQHELARRHFSGANPSFGRHRRFGRSDRRSPPSAGRARLRAKLKTVVGSPPPSLEVAVLASTSMPQ